MTDNNQPTLPPEEFDVRGIRGADGPIGTYAIDDLMFSAPIVTVETIRKQVEGLSQALNSLRVVDGQTPALGRAHQLLHASFAMVCAHSVAVDAYLKSAIAEDEASIAAAFRDEEDVALEAAAAALGSAHGI